MMSVRFIQMFGTPASVEISFVPEVNRGQIPNPRASNEMLQIFTVGFTQKDDDVSGNIDINIKRGKKLEHQGIRLELIGRIESNYERNQTSDFLSVSREIEPSGVLVQSTTIPFQFKGIEKQYETYYGQYCRLRYFLKVTVSRSYTFNLVKEQEFAIQIQQETPAVQVSAVKLEVGIEECLHIEFEYNKQDYHLKDVILGKVYFLLVRIRIRFMEVAIIRRETVGQGQNAYSNNLTVAKFQVMDGAPVKGESIPIRLFLNAFKLGPSIENANSRFSVRHFINLILVDEEERRYFKQQEIRLWRKVLGN